MIHGRRLACRDSGHYVLLEHLLVVCIIGAMGVIAGRSGRVALQHVRALDVIALSSSAKVALMEYHAVSGGWPDTNEQAPFTRDYLSVRDRSVQARIRPGGAIDYRLQMRNGAQTVTIRTATNPHEDGLPVMWICGHARQEPLRALAADATTLSDAQLPSPCIFSPKRPT